MGVEWIKWTKGLPAKPEVIRMAGILSIPVEFVTCKLMKFWEWCDDCIPCSDISKSGSGFVTLSPRDGDNLLFVDALVGTPNFANAMVAVGWLRCRDGRLELPNFGRHNGKTAKTRARNTKTQQGLRENESGDGGTQEGDVSPRRHQNVTNLSPRDGDKKVTRKDKSILKPKKATPPELAEKLDSTRQDQPLAENDGLIPFEGEKPPEEVKPPKKPQSRGPLFDAIAEVTGADISLEPISGHIFKVAKVLREAQPPYTPDDVRRFGKEFHVHCDYAKGLRDRPEIGELGKHIYKIRSKPVKPVETGGMKKYDPRNEQLDLGPAPKC
jgi:hypothetical protein